ncbi:MAG: hypothetical protein GF317_24215, partial [Candidatus Lokiarchaeota archaeon]|nr:hypothetical protein [Candidatus Lokiarchaeota archaeon]MBD3202479.1 hypothetical protein [Candidatus Lokiarchaeota archaeon]
MIYKIYFIDGKNGISLLESTFKEFQENHIDKNLFPKFFQAVNSTIDNVHKAMAKGED